MKRVAIFGNAGGGKSTLGRALARATGLPLHVVDSMRVRPGDLPLPQDEWLARHAAVLRTDEWIIDGYGGQQTLWERLDAADTLVHVDLPLFQHVLGVTQRFMQGLWSSPPGWPPDTPLLRTTMQGYRVLWPCHRLLTPRYRAYTAAAVDKQVVHLRSRRALTMFVHAFEGSAGARGANHG